MRSTCPDCTEAVGEIVDRRRSDTGGVIIAYECPECENEWTVTF